MSKTKLITNSWVSNWILLKPTSIHKESPIVSPYLHDNFDLLTLLDNNGMNISLSDTYDNYHDYEVRWTPDQIDWLVDGQVGRTKKRSETWNSTSNQWGFPQTPARVQLSIWPGGLATNGQGTIDWAGGLIDWNSPDIKQDGYYYAQFESVTVDCYNASSAPGTNMHTSYYYNDARGTNDTVVDSQKPTILKSFLGTGTNMSAGDTGAVPTGVATVPGNGNGTSPSGNDGHNNSTGTDTGSGSGSGSSDGSASGTDTGSSSAATSTDSFSQGSSTTKSAGVRLAAERGSALGGSVFAVVVAMAVLTFL